MARQFLWALCTIRSHGTKSHMLVSKLHSGIYKTMQLVPVPLDLPLFWKSNCVPCSPAYVILYHVTRSCKKTIQHESAGVASNEEAPSKIDFNTRLCHNRSEIIHEFPGVSWNVTPEFIMCVFRFKGSIQRTQAAVTLATPCRFSGNERHDHHGPAEPKPLDNIEENQNKQLVSTKAANYVEDFVCRQRHF